MNHHSKTIIPSKTKTIKNNKREETAHPQENTKKPQDHLFVSDRIPKPFIELAKYFFPSAKAIEEFWRMTTIAAYKNNLENETDTILSLSLDSFRQLIRKIKTTAKVKKPIAYYVGILNKKFQEIYFTELFEMGFNTVCLESLG